MKKTIKRKILALSIIFLMLPMTVVSINATKCEAIRNSNVQLPNYLGHIKVVWYSARLYPKVNITPAEDRNYSFPVDNGEAELNFTVHIETEAYSVLALSRWTYFEVHIRDNGEKVFLAFIILPIWLDWEFDILGWKPKDTIRNVAPGDNEQYTVNLTGGGVLPRTRISEEFPINVTYY